MMKFKIITKMIRKLNKFCFNKNHDDKCNGCIFKRYQNCPLNKTVDKLMSIL